MTTVIPTSPLTNLRDLGGIDVPGGRIRSGQLFRADDVALVDDVGAGLLISDGVGLVIDLRSPGEAQLTGRGVLSAHPVDYLHLPLTREVADPQMVAGMRELATAADPERAMGAWYATLVRDAASSIVRGLEAIADSDAAVVFHCAAGKDRTGVFAAGILSVLGASQDAIVADYARTGDNLDALLARLAAALPGLATSYDPSTIPPVLLSAPAGAMRAMLEILDETDGGFAHILGEAGLTEQTVTRLRERLVV